MLNYVRRSQFHAEVISTGPMEGAIQHLGWASDAAGAGPHLFLMKEAEGSDVCIVSGDDQTYATTYGGLITVSVRPTESVVTLTNEAARELALESSTIVITYDGDLIDIEYVRGQLKATLA